MPGRINMPTFRKRIARLRRLSGEAGRSVPTAGAIPITSPARTREEGRQKVDWPALLKGAVKGDWELPESGVWETAEDLEGALIFGGPDDIIESTRTFQEAGLDHLVYDLRFRFDDWEECVGILGEEVLPELRRGDAAAPASAQAEPVGARA
ncbi:MAG: Luciferase-like, subgroup [Thermomicrobiales bacterium]|nr:Luciferase-like, subgroup [Thermomicrobiales bacterium]